MRKKTVTVLFTAVATMAMSMTAFAGQWQSNATGWWYDNGNGTYPANCWQWIDGNNDGVAECYYFDGNGYMLSNTTAPDGYTVNESGAWVSGGVVQTQNGVAANVAETVENANTNTAETVTGVPNVAGTYTGSGITCTIVKEGEQFWAESDIEKDYIPAYTGNGVFDDAYMTYAFSGNTLVITSKYDGKSYTLTKK